jgi:hypothetical protein
MSPALSKWIEPRTGLVAFRMSYILETVKSLEISLSYLAFCSSHQSLEILNPTRFQAKPMHAERGSHQESQSAPRTIRGGVPGTPTMFLSIQNTSL